MIGEYTLIPTPGTVTYTWGYVEVIGEYTLIPTPGTVTYTWGYIEVIGEYTSVGILRTSRDLLKAHIQLIPRDALKEHTA